MESDALWYEVARYPATSAIACLLAGWYGLCHVKRWTPEVTGMNVCKIHDRGQWWRLLTGQLSHSGIVHLVFNLTSLWAVRSLEVSRGSVDFFKSCCILGAVSGMGVMLVHRCLPRSEQERRHLVGFSAVIFGLIALFTMHSDLTKFLGIVYLPMYCAPFASLIVIKLLVPRSSFAGHLCGIMAGYVLSLGLFSWLSDSSFLIGLPWSIALVVLSMKLRPSETFNPAFIEVPTKQATLDDLVQCSDYTPSFRSEMYRNV